MDQYSKYLQGIGQFLIRAGIGFFLSRYFFQPTPTNKTHDHHEPKEAIQDDFDSLVNNREITEPDAKSVDKELEKLVSSVKQGQGSLHSVANLSENDAKAKFNDLCSVYNDVCGLTTWQGAFSWTDKYLYQGLGIALMQTLDSNRITESGIQDILSNFKLYQSETDSRGSAGHTTVKIKNKNIPNAREYREVLTHELGHTVDLGVITGKAKKLHNDYTEFGDVIRPVDDPSLPFYQISWINESTRKRTAGFKDFVSGYGMKGIYEDFAECHNLRVNHNLLFQKLAADNDALAQKYAYFANLYRKQRFDDNPDSATKISEMKRPWDTTRIR